MGEKNNAMCSYLAKPEVFADFVNGILFEGKEKIKPEKLTACATGYNEALQEKGKKQRVIRTRDCLEAVCEGKGYVIIGAENQDKVHYAMPLRCMEYDVLEYARQLRRLREKNKAEGSLGNGDEYLSGIKRDDKLNPVITIVFYHGKKPYDGCRKLHDMLDLNQENEEFIKYVADYKMNLVTLQDMKEEVFRTGLREVTGIMKRSEDKEELISYCRRNEKRLRRLDSDAFDTVSVMINQKDLLKYKEEAADKKGEADMCKAIMEMVEEGKTEGKIEGIRQGEDNFACLTEKLLADSRTEDLLRAVKDVAFRKELYKEYGL